MWWCPKSIFIVSRSHQWWIGWRAVSQYQTFFDAEIFGRVGKKHYKTKMPKQHVCLRHSSKQHMNLSITSVLEQEQSTHHFPQWTWPDRHGWRRQPPWRMRDPSKFSKHSFAFMGATPCCPSAPWLTADPAPTTPPLLPCRLQPTGHVPIRARSSPSSTSRQVPIWNKPRQPALHIERDACYYRPAMWMWSWSGPANAGCSSSAWEGTLASVCDGSLLRCFFMAWRSTDVQHSIHQHRLQEGTEIDRHTDQYWLGGFTIYFLVRRRSCSPYSSSFVPTSLGYETAASTSERYTIGSSWSR